MTQQVVEHQSGHTDQVRCILAGQRLAPRNQLKQELLEASFDQRPLVSLAGEQAAHQAQHSDDLSWMQLHQRKHQKVVVDSAQLHLVTGDGILDLGWLAAVEWLEILRFSHKGAEGRAALRDKVPNQG